jgi:hypothetical protein
MLASKLDGSVIMILWLICEYHYYCPRDVWMQLIQCPGSAVFNLIAVGKSQILGRIQIGRAGCLRLNDTGHAFYKS